MTPFILEQHELGRSSSLRTAFGGLKFKILGISVDETSFHKRGFYHGDVNVRKHLEEIGRAFVTGYQTALGENEPGQLALRLNRTEQDQRGFAYEGAAMGLALLDSLSPWRNRRLQQFLHGPGKSHTYMIHVGVGWAIARVPWLRRRVDKVLNQFDPLLQWLILDGFGFQSAYFNWHRYVRQQAMPKSLSDYGLRAFDQGLGRSLWFVECGDVSRIPRTIAVFDPRRQPDLWSGVGLACAYAGGASDDGIEVLKSAAGRYLPEVAQGAAFAAKARERAGNRTSHTDSACRILCGVSAESAARITDEALAHLSNHANGHAYEIWRKKIQNRFALEM